MTLIVAGERSGVGKTTVTLALLVSLSRRHGTVQSFKVGPDYIDPMFHEAVTGRPCRTLDPVLTSEAYIQRCVATHTQSVDYGLVEGVMGLFDGATGSHDWASTAHIARLLDLPILLVLDCSHLSGSVAALAYGYRSLDPRLTFAGLVLNRVASDRHLEFLKAALAPLNFPILGVLQRQSEITLPDRHLGLVPTSELQDLSQRLEQLGHIGETCFDWPALLPLLAPSPQAGGPSRDDPHLNVNGSLRATARPYAPRLGWMKPFSNSLEADDHPAGPRSPVSTPKFRPPIRLAIAYDAAFNFYYPENLELLVALGAELQFWSPLADPALPEGTQGLYFGGGFPEIFAPALAANQSAQHSVKAAILAGVPTYAECGGLMYLCESLQDLQGQPWTMVGVLPAKVTMGARLTLGYRRAIAQQDTPILAAGTEVWGHEFHRSRLEQNAAAPIYQLSGYESPPSPSQPEGWRLYQLHASYVHLHWGDRPDLPQRFLQHCQSQTVIPLTSP